MAQLPTDAVKATAAKVVTASVTRVVTTLVDPAAAVRRAAADIKDLPRQAVGLPVRLALGGLVLFEKVRTALPGQGSADAPGAQVSAPDRPAPAPAATPTAGKPSSPVKAERTPAAGSRPTAAPGRPLSAVTAPPAAAKAAAAKAAVQAAPSGAELGSADLPLAGFDGLSLAQIRGRLAKLDVVQLGQLRDYERAHADRASVVAMLENRLAKVSAGGGSPA